MFRNLAAAILAMNVAAHEVQAQQARCDKVDVTFSCRSASGGGKSPYLCRAGESGKACCKRLHDEAGRKWCIGKEGVLSSFDCRCSGSSGRSGAAVRSKPTLRGVPGPGAAINGEMDRPIVTGRLMNPQGTRGGAAAESTDPAQRRAPRTLRDRSRLLSSPKGDPGGARPGDDTFQPGRTYPGVRLQQGQVLTDSDLNAQMSRVCRRTRYEMVCKDGALQGVNIVCKPGETAAGCCRRGRHAAIKDCLRHGGVTRMKCACPRRRSKRAP